MSYTAMGNLRLMKKISVMVAVFLAKCHTSSYSFARLGRRERGWHD